MAAAKNELKKLAETLHPLERAVFPHIAKHPDFDSLVKASKLQEVETMRAVQWLENKKIIEVKVDVQEIIELDKNGRLYATKGLPEKRFLKAIEKKELSMDSIQKAAGLERPELNVCIGLLKKKAAIDVKPGMKIAIAKQGEKILKKEWLEDLFLKKVSKGKIALSELSPEEKFSFDIFKKRKGIIKTNIKKLRTMQLTPLGTELSKIKIEGSDKIADRLTHDMLKNGEWKGKSFRRFDVKINVPKIHRGKRHFVNQATDYAKQVWIEMGFKEMTGPKVQTSFWNFDALFTAQDHPVREMQDTFFIGDPIKGKLPDKRLITLIKAVHEDGGDTGSTGWKYSWTEDSAKTNILRTHTTALSSRTLSTLKKEDLPAKYFAVGKCFRNETVDWSHLFEFNQFEGIVIDPDANFKHLLGYLKDFAKKIGFTKVRFRPAYFPYTEPSVEGDVYDPVHKQWIEVFAAGVFRPEVVKPLLGADIPVLAWGPGLDRMMLKYFEITDLRDLYKNDIQQLRSMKEWMK